MFDTHWTGLTLTYTTSDITLASTGLPLCERGGDRPSVPQEDSTRRVADVKLHAPCSAVQGPPGGRQRTEGKSDTTLAQAVCFSQATSNEPREALNRKSKEPKM